MQNCEWCNCWFLPTVKKQNICGKCLKLSKGILCQQCGTRFKQKKLKNGKLRRKKLCYDCVFENNEKELPGIIPVPSPLLPQYKKLKNRAISPKLRFEILMRDNFTCQYCGRNPQDGCKMMIDHIHPKSKGGKDAISNLITACEECNLGKSDKILKARILSSEEKGGNYARPNRANQSGELRQENA